jgi:methyltransferase (TIGR00027 family)
MLTLPSDIDRAAPENDAADRGASASVKRSAGCRCGVIKRRLDKRASWTAQVTAAQRAAETLRPADHRLLDDPYARQFVHDPAVRALVQHPLAARGFLGALNRLFGAEFHAFIMLRSRYADDACAAAANEGMDQIVLLGAGFDTTALRMARTAVTVFEVDAPTTLQIKRHVVEKLTLTSAPGEKGSTV